MKKTGSVGRLGPAHTSPQVQTHSRAATQFTHRNRQARLTFHSAWHFPIRSKENAAAWGLLRRRRLLRERHTLQEQAALQRMDSGNTARKSNFKYIAIIIGNDEAFAAGHQCASAAHNVTVRGAETGAHRTCRGTGHIRRCFTIKRISPLAEKDPSGRRRGKGTTQARSHSPGTFDDLTVPSVGVCPYHVHFRGLIACFLSNSLDGRQLGHTRESNAGASHTPRHTRLWRVQSHHRSGAWRLRRSCKRPNTTQLNLCDQYSTCVRFPSLMLHHGLPFVDDALSSCKVKSIRYRYF